MDRTTRIGYILILILFLGFLYFSNDNEQELERQNEMAEDAERSAADAERSADTITIDSVPMVSDTQEDDTMSDIVVVPEEFTDLKNDVLNVRFSSKGGIPIRVELSDYHRYDSSALVLFDQGQNRFNYTIPTTTGVSINTENLDFTSEETDSSVIYTAELLNGATMVQTYTLSTGSYRLKYQVRFDHMDRILAPNNRYATIDWEGQMQGQEKSIKDERGASTVYYKYAADDGLESLSETKDEDDDKLLGNVQWISFKQKFFNQTLIHSEGFNEDGIEVEIKTPANEEYVKDVSAKIYLSLDQDRVTENMEFYYGPNHYQTLKKVGVGMEQMIPLGRWIFRWVNRYLVIPIFNFLEGYISNYGLIILLLTLTIKLMLFFPMYRVYKSTAKMRLLKPELDEIKERTGGDMQKMQQEQMKLYKQAGVSPLGGCLPQLVQLPILFAMFRFFPASIELRQEKLWWADDLSSYDSIFDFPGGFEIPFYGDHISLFTLMMTAVTLFYTVMNSRNSSQLQGPMKMVMYLMPIMFLGFFNNYAAALSLYYFLSTSITIIQNFIIRKFVIDEDKLHRQIQDSKKKKVSVKKSNFQKRLEDMAKKRGIDPYTGKQKGDPPKGKKKK